jgi:hypothetical protein
MPRRKPSQASNEPSEKSPHPSPSSAPPAWKWKVAVFVFGLLIVSALWSSGVFKSLFAGPKTPLPRGAVNLQLGMSLDQVLQLYPLMNLGDVFKEYPGMTIEEIAKKHSKVRKNLDQLKKTLRSFNNDPDFGITTITNMTGLSGASSMDVLFYKGQLYFTSTLWEEDLAKQLPFSDWVKQFRRWNRTSNGSGENLGGDVLLKEWHFNDNQTEMTLRDLNYSGKLQRWQDLRDASNQAAQNAFAKYRLDATN